MEGFAYSRVASRLFGRPLAIEETIFKPLLESLGPRIVSGDALPAALEYAPTGGQGRVVATLSKAQALQKRMAMIAGGQHIDVGEGAGSYCRTPGGVAVVPILGPLAQRFDWIAAVCGFNTYEGIAATFDALAADGQVKAVLVDYDTPGGEAMGMFDLADRMLAFRQVKPCWAVANGMACSAGYALAGSAERLITPRMAVVGSIGAMVVHVDRSAQDEMMGLKYSAIFSGRRKLDGWSHKPLDKEARDRAQADLDRVRDTFCELVARQGRIDAATALATEADTLRDSAAVDAHLSDAVQSFDDTLKELEELAAGRPAKSTTAAYAVNHTGNTTMTNPTPTAGAPAPATAPVAAAAAPAPIAAAPVPAAPPAPQADQAEALKTLQAQAEADKAEASRVSGIVELCHLAGQPQLAHGYIAGKQSLDQVRTALAGAKAAASDARPVDGTAPAPSTASTIDTAAIYARRNGQAAA